MKRGEELSHSPEIQSALEIFNPQQYGFSSYENGWIRTHTNGDPMVVAPLSWEHNQTPSYYYDPEKGKVETSAINLIAILQQRVWQFPDMIDAVPANFLSVLDRTGGGILAAYNPDLGLNEDGWQGLIFAAGSHRNKLVSHMLGVREEFRSQGVGRDLKLIQAHQALQNGLTEIEWTYDPMRGINARLNIEKLGGVAKDFTINKYGANISGLYDQSAGGSISADLLPYEDATDRITIDWDLTSPRTWERTTTVTKNPDFGLRLTDIAALPNVTPDNLSSVLNELPAEIVYEIPAAIGSLSKEASLTAKRDLRTVFGALLDTEVIDQRNSDPASTRTSSFTGDYFIDGFATNGDGPRQNYYRLKRK